MKILRSILVSFLGLGILIAVYFVFIGDWFLVNGESMSPTLHDGERIRVNKCLMGARIYKNFNFDSPELACFRMPGIRPLRVGDIAVFNYIHGWENGTIGYKINYVYTKRCIACPGDSISISNCFYHNNNAEDVGIPVEMEESLVSTPDSVLARQNINVRAYFPYRRLGWTVRNFGPLYVPRKGDTLKLNIRNLRTYYQLIEYETGIMPAIAGRSILINEMEADQYVFTHDYYFFAGDNVIDSFDSRYFGLVPDDYIIGIVAKPKNQSRTL